MTLYRSPTLVLKSVRDSHHSELVPASASPADSPAIVILSRVPQNLPIQQRVNIWLKALQDLLTRVERGGFYGWPYAYIGPHADPNHKERPPRW